MVIFVNHLLNWRLISDELSATNFNHVMHLLMYFDRKWLHQTNFPKRVYSYRDREMEQLSNLDFV